MKFLISNDDGVHAPGLLALYHALSKVGEVTVVAPAAKQSGCGSAINILQPLYTHQLASGFIAVNGTPADCIYLALHELYRDIEFDCVVTGINSGANLGQDVLFSGTFGAALTAQLHGIPAIATSLVGGAIKGNGQDNACDYQIAAEEIAKLLTDTPILAEIKRLPYYVLNVNIPDVKSSDDIKGRKITHLGHSPLARPVHHVIDPRGRDAYWLSLRKCQHSPQSEVNNDDHEPLTIYTDGQAVAAGYVSLSPVKLHHTPTTTINKLAALAW